MNLYRVILAVARAARFDTGRQIKMQVMAASRFDAALVAEQQADTGLLEPDVEYTHATDVALLTAPAHTAVAA